MDLQGDDRGNSLAFYWDSKSGSLFNIAFDQPIRIENLFIIFYTKSFETQEQA